MNKHLNHLVMGIGMAASSIMMANYYVKEEKEDA
jgi:hypothetical protein